MTPALSEEVPAVMSVDVEDWFHVENLRPVIDRDSWGRQKSRVERNVDRLLELMAGSDVGMSCTWFILGWVAERFPHVVRRIADAGHEVASHGYSHDLLDNLSREAFRADVRRSKQLLEDIAGEPVRGYRAPSFSIKEWAIPVLHDVGFVYDSSLFPSVGHDRYGRLPGVATDEPITEILPGFFEISVSTMSVASVAVPWGGGGYFRLLPYPIFRAGARRILRSGRPYVFYIHPWEIDPDQPRPDGLPRLYRFRHYVGLERCEARFRSLLADFSWTTMADLLERTGFVTRSREAGV
jgi:polysaccharide deacetylase family protein (PEP-CTERM system associated)